MGNRCLSLFLQRGLVILVFLVPLIFSHATTEVYGLIKVVVLEMGVLVLLILWLIQLAQEKAGGQPLVKAGPLGWAILIFFSVAILSLIKASNIHEGIKSIYQLGAGVGLFFLVINNVKERKFVNEIIFAMVLAGLAACFFSIYENRGIRLSTVRLAYTSTFGNPIFFAQYLSMVIPVSLAMCLRKNSARRGYVSSAFFGFSALVMLVLLVLTRSRGAYLGFFIAFLYCYIVIFLRSGKKLRKILIALVIISLVASSLSLAFLSSAKGWVGEKINLRNLMRAYVWSSTFEMVKDRPILGVGAGNFKVTYPLYRSDDERKITPKGVRYSKAHNDFLQIWAETGTLGLISFFGILFFFLQSALGLLRKKTDSSTYISLGLSAGIIALLVQAFFNPLLYISTSSMGFWVLLGLVVCAGEKGFLKTGRGEAISLSGRRWVIRLAIGVIILIMLVFLPVRLAKSFIGDCLLQRARISHAQEDTEKTLTELKRSLSFEPMNVEALFLLGGLYQKMGIYSSAADSYKEALLLHPYWVTVWNNLGTTYMQAGDFNEAISSFKKTVEIDGRYIGAHYNLALAYEKIGKKDMMEVELETIRELDPGFLGDIYMIRGLYDESAIEYYRAIRLSPDSVEAYYKLGAVREKQGRLDEAIEMYEKAAGLRPDHVEAHNALAVLYRKKGLLDKAVSAYEQTVQAIPEAMEKIYERTSFYTELGIYKQVLEEYAQIEKLKEIRQAAIKELAAIFKAKGLKNKSIEEYKELVEVSPEDREIRKALALLFEEEGRYKEAVGEYKRILKSPPEGREKKMIVDTLRRLERISAHLALASVYEKQGLKERAIEEYLKAITFEPEGGFLYNSLASLYNQTGEKYLALKFFKKAIDADPVYVASYLALAQLFREDGKFNDAEREYRKALEINPEDIQAHLSLGLLFEEEGLYTKAEKEYETVLRLEPDSQEAQILIKAIREREAKQETVEAGNP